MIKPGVYRHFKGKRYRVLFEAVNSETGERMVVYLALYGEGKVWVRPASRGEVQVEADGVTQPSGAFESD